MKELFFTVLLIVLLVAPAIKGAHSSLSKKSII